MQTLHKIFLFFFLPLTLTGNPFAIDFPIKETLENEDYLAIQEQIKHIDIKPFIDAFYPTKPPAKSLFPWSSRIATKEDFSARIGKAINQTFIDPEKGWFPSKQLIKIGKGSDRCIVSYATFNGKYTKLLEDLPAALEHSGFHGYLFLMIGGFPNPTGKEIRYCAVPYCFKIFTLLEAEKLGFSKVLWVDAAFVPLKDPSPLFSWIEEEGAFLKLHQSSSKFILPKTRSYLKQITGVDPVETRYMSAQIFGFDLNHPKAREFISSYYNLVELGFPFFSCFPEEYVFSCIVGQKPFQWKNQPYDKLSFPELKLRGKEEVWAQKKGYFFLQKNH